MLALLVRTSLVLAALFAVLAFSSIMRVLLLVPHLVAIVLVHGTAISSARRTKKGTNVRVAYYY